MTSSWFFLSTLNYDARSTTHQISFRGSDPRISHVVHSLIRGEENFSTVVVQLLSKLEGRSADTCDDDSNCINKRAVSARDVKVKGKGKFQPRTDHKGPEG